MPLNISITHIQLHIYGFSYMVGMFSSSEYGDVLEKRGAPVRIPCNYDSTELFKSAYKVVQTARLHQRMHFYISFAFVNTIG